MLIHVNVALYTSTSMLKKKISLPKNHSHQPSLLKVDEKLLYEYYKSLPLYQQLYSLALGEEHLTSQAGWVSKTKLRA